MKTNKRHYINKRNKTFRKKSKYNKRGGIWGWDITGRKNVNSTRYRELKNTENEYKNVLSENEALKNENKALKNENEALKKENYGRNFSKNVTNEVNTRTMRELYEENKKLKNNPKSYDNSEYPYYNQPLSNYYSGE